MLGAWHCPVTEYGTSTLPYLHHAEIQCIVRRQTSSSLVHEWDKGLLKASGYFLPFMVNQVSWQ